MKQKLAGPLVIPRDYTFEWRWLSRAEIAIFTLLALLVIWPLVDAAIAVHVLP